MIIATLLLSIAPLLQSDFPPIDASFFLGKWTTTVTDGPVWFEVTSDGGKLWITIDRVKTRLEGTAFLATQQRPPQTVAITARSTDRLFIVRRDDKATVLEMFSTFSDRPPLYWMARFAKK